MSDKKTADLKKYQAEYAKAHPRDNKEYMANYIKKAEDIECPICKEAGTPGRYKSYAKYRHDSTQKHKTAALLVEAKEALAKKEVEALEKRGKPPSTPQAAPKKRGRPPKAKEEKPKSPQESESSSESESETEEEEKIVSGQTYEFKKKRIQPEAVVAFLEKHFAESANPDRAADTKTKRQNKNLSLWRKVAPEVVGRTWRFVGRNFGRIVSWAYDKPSSQADFIQMLKLVITHFTKVPVETQKEISLLARKLKESHKAKGK
tara:strand:+ start:668 stop:1453 length:786 start_codon:yes stop_codon:yes gene_type:complete